MRTIAKEGFDNTWWDIAQQLPGQAPSHNTGANHQADEEQKARDDSKLMEVLIRHII